MAWGRMLSVRWLGATVLLGCGASALSPSRVAFGQHGVAEGDENVMHAPAQGGSSRLASLTPQLLSSAIARVMSLDARAEVGSELPAGDIFNRPDGNVLVFVDGLRPQGSKSTPFMTNWLQQPTTAYSLRTPTDNSWTSGLQSALGASFDVVDAVHNKGGVVCAAVDPNLIDSDACAFAQWAVPVVDAKAYLSGNNVYMGPGVKVDYSSGLRTLSLQGGDDTEEGVPLDLTAEADLRLAEELTFLSLLPEALTGTFSSRRESSPPLVIVYLSSLKAIKSEYGETSAKGALAFKALDAALAESFDIMSTGAGRRLTSQLVAGPALAETLAVGGRRLAGNSTSTSNGNVTLVDIAQFQLNMWTGVGLALVGFLAIYATFTMDVQPDSLLYAKFITDTSGGGLKTD